MRKLLVVLALVVMLVPLFGSQVPQIAAVIPYSWLRRRTYGRPLKLLVLLTPKFVTGSCQGAG
jgi:hypothetical protein